MLLEARKDRRVRLDRGMGLALGGREISSKGASTLTLEGV